MPTHAMRAFVWDLADEGLDEVLGRLKDSGIDGLHLAMISQGGRYYCPHNPKRTLIHAPDGALFFQPFLPGYEQLRPPLHPEFGSGAFVERVREATRDYGMALVAWVELFNNQTLSLAHPDCAIKNAVGDRLQGTLCPANPAVRTYAQALIEDLSHRVEVDNIEIQNFAYPSHDAWRGARWQEIAIGANLGYLLSLCFCPHCRERAEEANIEVDDLEHHVERMIHAALAGDLSERRIGDEISDPYHPVGRYGLMRSEVVNSLVDELLDAARGSDALLQPVLAEEPDDNWRWGIELHALRQRVPRITIRAPGRRPLNRSYLERYAELLQMGHDLAADISLTGRTLDPNEEPGWSRGFDACLQAGISRFIFSHYGLAPLDALDWIEGLARHS